eukprot:320544_1
MQPMLPLSTLRSILFYIIVLIKLSSCQFQFSLNIPRTTQCNSVSCYFKWPTQSHYGYVFDITNNGTTIDLDTSKSITFSTIAINYVTYNSIDPSCNPTSGFIEAYTYDISIYHRKSSTNSWSRKQTLSAQIDRSISSGIDRISLTNPLILTTGQWYIGLKLAWNVLFQQCDFIMRGWNISTVTTYPITNLISNINTNDYITFKNIICLHGDVLSNNEIPLSTNILPHFDIEFTMYTFSTTSIPTLQPTISLNTNIPSITPTNNAPTPNPTKSPSKRPTDKNCEYYGEIKHINWYALQNNNDNSEEIPYSSINIIFDKVTLELTLDIELEYLGLSTD